MLLKCPQKKTRGKSGIWKYSHNFLGRENENNTYQISQQGLRTISEGNASLSRYTLPKFPKPGLQGLQGGGGFS